MLPVPGADGLVSEHRFDTGRSLWYAFDGETNTRFLTDSGGNVADTYSFSAYGQQTSGTGSDINPYRYKGAVGYYLDAYAPPIVLCGQRWYAPQFAQWLGRDPAGYAGGADLYGYCGDSPITGVDPDGLRPYTVLSHRVIAGHDGRHGHTPSFQSVVVAYTIDVPAGQYLGLNVAAARQESDEIAEHGWAAYFDYGPDQWKWDLDDKYTWMQARVAHGTCGDYASTVDPAANPTLFLEREYAGNFNYGAMSEALGFSLDTALLAAQAIHVKDTVPKGASVFFNNPLHPAAQQHAVEDGWNWAAGNGLTELR